MNWHACGEGFDSEKMALNLTVAFNFYQEKKWYKYLDVFSYDLKKCTVANHTDVGTIDLAKRIIVLSSDGKMAVKLSLLKKDETSWDVAALLTILADEKRTTMKRAHSVDLLSSSCLEYHPPLRGDCNTGQ